VDKAVNIILGNNFSDALSALDMNIFQGVIPIGVKDNNPKTQGSSIYTWWDNLARLGYKPRLNVGRFPPRKGCFLNRIPSGALQ
jgi:hypothetical protein